MDLTVNVLQAAKAWKGRAFVRQRSTSDTRAGTSDVLQAADAAPPSQTSGCGADHRRAPDHARPSRRPRRRAPARTSRPPSAVVRSELARHAQDRDTPLSSV